MSFGSQICRSTWRCAGPASSSYRVRGGALYTRNGHFVRSDAGLLVSKDGFPVLGADGQAIALQNAEGGAVESSAVTFKQNGEVFAGDDLIAALRFVEIPAASLVRASETSFTVARAVTPVTSGATVLVQGALEESNIDIGRAATQLFEVSQALPGQSACLSHD